MKNTRSVEREPVAEAAVRMRVLIADDQAVLREGLRALLEPACAEVVLIDLSLPEALGLEAIREVRRRCAGAGRANAGLTNSSPRSTVSIASSSSAREAPFSR